MKHRLLIGAATLLLALAVACSGGDDGDSNDGGSGGAGATGGVGGDGGVGGIGGSGGMGGDGGIGGIGGSGGSGGTAGEGGTGGTGGREPIENECSLDLLSRLRDRPELAYGRSGLIRYVEGRPEDFQLEDGQTLRLYALDVTGEMLRFVEKPEDTIPAYHLSFAERGRLNLIGIFEAGERVEVAQRGKWTVVYGINNVAAIYRDEVQGQPDASYDPSYVNRFNERELDITWEPYCSFVSDCPRHPKLFKLTVNFDGKKLVLRESENGDWFGTVSNSEYEWQISSEAFGYTPGPVDDSGVPLYCDEERFYLVITAIRTRVQP